MSTQFKCVFYLLHFVQRLSQACCIIQEQSRLSWIQFINKTRVGLTKTRYRIGTEEVFLLSILTRDIYLYNGFFLITVVLKEPY